jgi:hypothetical protein
MMGAPMDTITRMLEAHPNGRSFIVQTTPMLMQEMSDCEAACIICADACLAEDDVQMLARCIALNVDCADVCAATDRMLGRILHQSPDLVRTQVEACREATRMCAEECERHEHTHCRICAEACRRTEQACTQALQSMSVVSV